MSTIRVCARCGAPWVGIRKRCTNCPGRRAIFIDKPAWHIVKCQCGAPVCNVYSVEGGGVHGTFYQGCGWDKPVAEYICKILNAHWDNWLYDPAQPEKVE